MHWKSLSRLKSETVIGGGLRSITGSTAFNGSYVGAIKSVAFGHEQSFIARLKILTELLWAID